MARMQLAAWVCHLWSKEGVRVEGWCGTDCNLVRWQELRAKGVDMGDRLLVPMHIWFCIYTCSQSARDRMQRYLLTLDTRWRYYLILGMDKGLAMWWMDGFPRGRSPKCVFSCMLKRSVSRAELQHAAAICPRRPSLAAAQPDSLHALLPTQTWTC